MGKKKKRKGRGASSHHEAAIVVARKLYREFGCGVHVGMKGGTMLVYWSLIKCRPDFEGCFYGDAFRAYLDNLSPERCRRQPPSQPSPSLYVPGPMRTNIPPSAPEPPNALGDSFLASYEWRSLRMKILVKYGRRCQCCGATPDDGVKMHVDHIKPRRTHPELALDPSNLQVLCEVCNHGKGNWDSTDWRAPNEEKQ